MRRENWILNNLWLLILMFFLFTSSSFSQPGLIKKAINVTATQAINFGSFCVTGNAGGTITVGWDGSRTASGDIVLLATEPTAQPATFELKLNQGKNVIITYPVSTTLIGGNGESLTVDIGPTEKGDNGASFTVNKDWSLPTTLRVGGTLHIPGKFLSGTYKGYFEITFNQE